MGQLVPAPNAGLPYNEYVEARPAEWPETRFRGARRDLVARHLETLAILGEVRVTDAGRYAGAAPL